jgi:hypothetical protein
MLEVGKMTLDSVLATKYRKIRPIGGNTTMASLTDMAQ